MDWLGNVKKRFGGQEALKRLIEERDQKQAPEQADKDGPDELADDFKELFLDSLKANRGLLYINGLLDMIEAGAITGAWREHLRAWTRTQMHQHQRTLMSGEITRLRLDSDALPHESAARIRGLGQAQDATHGGPHQALGQLLSIGSGGAGGMSNFWPSNAGMGVVHTQTANAVNFVSDDVTTAKAPYATICAGESFVCHEGAFDIYRK